MLGCGGERDVVRERVVAHLYLGIGGFDFVGLERRTAYKTGIGYHAKTPDIYFIRVAIEVSI